MNKYPFILSGMLNNHDLKARKFKTLRDAERDLDTLLINKNLEVSYVLKDENSSTYVVNDYSRFTLVRM